MRRSELTPDEFLASLEDPRAPDMRKLDAEISQVMKRLDRYLLEGTFWGGSDQQIIAYGTYRYTNRSGKDVEWHIAGLALQKNAISVYVNAVDDGKYLAEIYADQLGKAKVGKSAVTFKKLEDIDLDALLGMIAQARDLMTGSSPQA